MPSTVASETAREREVYKYYQPLYITGDQRVPRSSWDTSLTAFAQLGALRLNAKRCLISLVTRDTTYVISEATRTLSLRRDDVHEENDSLWFGVCTLPKNSGICSHSVDVFAGLQCGCEAECMKTKNGPPDHIEINNLLEDGCALRRKAAESNPNLRFYISVPITTVAGFVIGSYSIFDDSPRNGTTSVDLAFLKDMAVTVMDHLVANRTKSLHYRAEKMIKGIGLFVEGGSTLREWWLRTGHEASSRKSENTSRGEPSSLDEQADHEFGVQDAPELLRASSISSINTFGHPSIASKRPIWSDSGSVSAESSQLPESVNSESQQVSHEPSTAFESVRNTEVLNASSKPVSKLARNSDSGSWTSFGTTDTAATATMTPGSQLQESILSNDLKTTFSRASNLIRESLSMTGVLFLDASVGSWGGRSKDGMMKDAAPSQFAHVSTPYPTTSSSEDERRNKVAPADSGGRESTSTSAPQTSQNCGILGYSTHNRSSLMMHSATELHSTVPESFLRRLLKRYPHGKIFNLDEDGNISSSEDPALLSGSGAGLTMKDDKGSQARKTKRKQLSKEAEFKTILETLPGARSIAFFPLWDAHKERWFAGGFLWTTQPTRVLVPEDELTFFAAFSNSIMAECARLDALVAAQMKINFLSSISHELRSPLHGVLAGVELLQESNLDISQVDMVKMIGACGNTLLDTINHVLDFTKVNSKSKEKARKSKKSKGTKEYLDQKTTLDLENTPTAIPDLAILTEEVVSSVYAGYHHRVPSINGKESISIPGYDMASGAGFDIAQRSDDPMPVMIIMDIAHRESYRFPIAAGAWRRIIMNLFGNAIKYTSAGFVRVSLQTEDVLKGGSPRTLITLSVSDSGQGMSPEYLQNHLYTPFHQENSLSAGTGLGLSIIRQIVDDLGGSIDFNSTQGAGTEAIISLTLPGQSVFPKESSVPATLGSDIESARQRTRGLKACLISFDVTPDMDDTSGILSGEAERMFALKNSFCALLENWFLMEVISSPTITKSAADVYMILETDFNDLKTSGHFDDIDQARRNSPSTLHPPLVLVLSSKASDMKNKVTKNYNIIKLQQPFGPHRMAKVFSRCFTEIRQPLGSHKTARAGARPIPTRTSSRSPVEISPSPSFPQLNSTTPHLAIPTLKNSTTSPRKNQRPTNPRTESYDPDHTLPNVLLVEDNEINLKLLVTFMRRLSVPYLTASNGFEALQCYKSNDILFDIVLMDVSMPIMDGLTASREIRSFERIADRTPATIIALTGAASPQARQEAFASGIDRYLTKPVPMKVLKSILDEFQIRQPTRRGVDVDGQSSSGSQSGMKVSFEEASTSRPSPP